MNADAGLTASLVIHFPAGLLLNIGAGSPLEYDTKSDFLNMDAQKDAQAICKTLKISDFVSPMLQPPFFRRKNFGLASLWVCQANFFMQQREIKNGGGSAEAGKPQWRNTCGKCKTQQC